MIMDALNGTPWNSVHWAVANLHRATGGNHEVFRELAVATETQMEGQQFFQNAVRALRENDKKRLDRYVTPPSGMQTLSSNDPHFSAISSLWNAAASAEASLG
jgi:hypothetical protein